THTLPINCSCRWRSPGAVVLPPWNPACTSRPTHPSLVNFCRCGPKLRRHGMGCTESPSAGGERPPMRTVSLVQRDLLDVGTRDAPHGARTRDGDEYGGAVQIAEKDVDLGG